ncbi:pyruvate/ketoisovalerate oxidoreductase, gamma subunit [Pyrolobus fumarii 1A]|uniref:Pyruvate/ketoisovalerate oxidoreductase, gamma subunit n=1 Tax=Pyrolobus fumarii (strain DSM 11204 / 1A) TaxID=694429 RepID=G0EGA6_PYRF1|nr:2-oxoacid:acceptor oxidoreductase family protein [Pyrolobus fumarii]AEM39131.1 pyruvate/ketoisovalerate oxidoreductase, gamma subunit [Pyrolobus fumarii 1A]
MEARSLDVRITGIGGQGVLTIAKILGSVAVQEGRYVTLIQKFDAFISGGESTAEMRLSEQPIDFPLFKEADVTVFLAPKTVPRYAHLVKPGSIVIVNSDAVKTLPDLNAKVYSIPASSTAIRLGNLRAANMVVLGALVAVVPLVDPNKVADAIAKRYPKFAELNTKAFWEGYKMVKGEVSG